MIFNGFVKSPSSSSRRSGERWGGGHADGVGRIHFAPSTKLGGSRPRRDRLAKEFKEDFCEVISYGSRRFILILQFALLFTSLAVISGCWIPLPEETAIVVEVFDARGGPVDGVNLLLDGTDTIVTGSQLDAGQVFKSLSVEGDHTIQLDTATLVDPQGGIGWVPLASQISGELLPLSFANRPFAGGSDVLIVPVNKGEITVVTVYLDDVYKSPMDNQWLTDGFDSANPYRTSNADEFTNPPNPVFWWRQDPSLGTTVTFTFQLWEDDDGDTRFPLGVIDPAGYSLAMDPSNAGYKQPDWQVPLAGNQRAETGGVNQVTLWSSQASDISTPVDYDLYYAPTSQWNNLDWEKNPVLRDITPEGNDGAALKFAIGSGTTNAGVVIKNGVEYTFALRARDGASNLDTTGPISTRRATPPGSASSLGSVNIVSAVADSISGGQIDIDLTCAPAETLRVYAAPSADFNARPFDIRFIRDIYTCLTPPNSYTLDNLVNGVTYAVGFEPFDASGNVGTASSVVIATPSSASASDTIAPFFLGTPITVDTAGLNPGQVRLTIAAAADSNNTSIVIRRVSWSPASFTNDLEAMLFTDLNASPATSLIFADIPSQIPFNYAVRAIDDHGNVSAIFNSQVTLTETDTTGPTWASDVSVFYSTISYAPVTTTNVWDLGATWSYGSVTGGFALGQDPAQGEGEYVWRIIQENPVRGVSIDTKLGAFYTYSGYYYASTESGGLDMSSSGPGRPGGGPSSNADHRDVFGFVEAGISSADVMGSPFDSTDSAGYRQRTASQYSASLAAGSSSTNQLTILYNTDEDGQAVVSQEAGGGYLGILRVFAANKQRPLPTPEPHLQGKEFQMSYFTDTNQLVTFPVPLFGGGVFYFGLLADPDFQDPLW